MTGAISAYSNSGNNDNNNNNTPTLTNWTPYTYTDGFGNTYELKKCTYTDNSGKTRVAYKWGDDIYYSWSALVEDMKKAVSDNTYNASSSTFASEGPTVSGLWYAIDGLSVTFSKDPNFRGSNLRISGGAINVNGEDGWGISVRYRF